MGPSPVLRPKSQWLCALHLAWGGEYTPLLGVCTSWVRGGEARLGLTQGHILLTKERYVYPPLA